MNARKYQMLLFCMVFIGGVNLLADTADTSLVISSEQSTSQAFVPNPRSRKHTAQGKKKKQTVKQMNETELATLQAQALASKNYTSAIKIIEQRLKITADPELIAQLLFELGSMLFDSGQFDKATIVFDDFKVRFKGHSLVEEAYYKSTLACYYTTLDAERDQSNTKKTITHADHYLKTEHNFSKYTQEVKLLRKQCFVKKAESEFKVCEFYKKRGANKSVQQRLAYIEKELLPELPEIATTITALEQELTQHTVILTAAPKKQQQVASEPNEPKRNMQDRF